VSWADAAEDVPGALRAPPSPGPFEIFHIVADLPHGKYRKVVLGDVANGALADAAQRLRSAGAEVAAIHCDVSRPDEVEHLAASAVDAFGSVHVVCNNAGVADMSGTSVWEVSLADWEWVLGVNFWGVLHGISSFVPLFPTAGAGLCGQNRVRRRIARRGPREL
jgi:NAD(P)-dependent dehydrogenase (short-subunit alcohol dehydrogenase family)